MDFIWIRDYVGLNLQRIAVIREEQGGYIIQKSKVKNQK
jgi:hypothetical protein